MMLNTNPSAEIPCVACYWDFENVHASAADSYHYAGFYRGNRFQPQPLLLNLAAVMNYINGLGRVVLNRAYSPWDRFQLYLPAMAKLGIEAVDLHAHGKNQKNSADIALALAAAEDITQRAIQIMVIISSDADFIPLVQRAHLAGIKVIGIGATANASPHWRRALDSFVSLDQLSGIQAHAGGKFSEVRALLREALERLFSGSASRWVSASLLKTEILQRFPNFREKVYGYSAFGRLLAAFPDVVRVVPCSGGLLVRPAASGRGRMVAKRDLSYAEGMAELEQLAFGS